MSSEESACIFCKIANHEDNTEIIHETQDICVFRDIRPASKRHLLAIPKVHIKDAKCLTSDDKKLVEDLIQAAQEGLKKLGDDFSDVRYGFHLPPFHMVSHLHLHAISPAYEMKFISRLIFKQNSYWFVSPTYLLSNL